MITAGIRHRIRKTSIDRTRAGSGIAMRSRHTHTDRGVSTKVSMRTVKPAAMQAMKTFLRLMSDRPKVTKKCLN